MSALNQIQNGFQNLLENGFEKLEKKEEKEFFLLGPFLLPQPNSPACCDGPVFLFLSLPRRCPPRFP
jgi:hypothetical protein